MSSPRYPWIITRTRRRILPSDRPRTYPADQTCSRCGYTPVGRRKKCPACFVRLDQEAGHVRVDVQLFWFVFVVVFIVVGLRIVGLSLS